MRDQITFPVCYKSVPCCHPPPILPPRCNPILYSHAAAKIVKLQHHTNTAGACRWWSTVSCTFQGSQSKRSDLPFFLTWSVLLFHLTVKQFQKEQKNQSLLMGASLAASTAILIIRSVCRHQSQIIPIYLAAYHHIIMGNYSLWGLDADSDFKVVWEMDLNGYLNW